MMYDYIRTERFRRTPSCRLLNNAAPRGGPTLPQPLIPYEKEALIASVGNSYTILWLESWEARWAMSKLLFASAKIRLTIPEAYEVHRAVIQWNARDSVDRIPDAAIGLDSLTLKLMRWAMGSWERVSFLNNYMAGHLIPRIELDLIPALRCAGHFILLRNEEPKEIDDNVEAGRAMQRFWLTATKLGLQLQPEMTPLIFTRYVRQGIPLSQVWSAGERAEDLAVVLDRLTGNRSARMMFMGRIGHGQPPRARSMRLSLADLQQSAPAREICSEIGSGRLRRADKQQFNNSGVAMVKEIDFEKLVLIAGGHSAFQLLWAGVELGLYDQLAAKPDMNLDEVAGALGLSRQPARILMTGLTALGLVIRSPQGSYRNASLTEARLVKGKPGYAAPILGWQAHIVYPGMQDFVASLKQNRNVGLGRFAGTESTLYQRLTHDKPLQKIFQDAMSSLSKQANSFLPAAMDFGKYKLVVDAGGGDGTNAWPLPRAILQSKLACLTPHPCANMPNRISSRPAWPSRVSTWAGNFFHDPLPPGTDCVVYCHILTIWSMEHNRVLLKRAFDGLPAGGAVVIFNMMGADDDSGPLSAALGSPYFLAIATGEGMLHSWKDYEAALRDAGFKQTIRLDQGLPLDHGILVGIK